MSTKATSQVLLPSMDYEIFELDPSSLPGDEMNTSTSAAADVNGDGHIDLIIGNFDRSNQVLIQILPGGGSPTRAIVMGDLNKDGWVDNVVGDYGQNNREWDIL